MGAKPDELQGVGVWLLVDRHQVGLDVTVPMVFPVASQRVVTVLLRQRMVVCQRRDNGNEITLQRLPVRAFGLAFQIALKLSYWGQTPISLRCIAPRPPGEP